MNTTAQQEQADTNHKIKHLEKQHGVIVKHMLDIRSMAKGKITEQFHSK